MLELKSISKKYMNEKEFILDEVSLCFKENQMTVIIGESGSGKSTIMNILGGLDLEYSGDIFYKNNKILKNNIDNYRRNNVGFIFQSFNLLPHLTAFENVELSLKIKGNYSKKKVEKVFEKLKISDLKSKNINELSGGQKQRVAIARAIVNDPDIILADEPTGSLDPNNTKIIMEILKDLKEEGKIVIVVTHSKEVSEYADKIIEVKNSKVHVIKESTKNKKLFTLKEKEIKNKKIISIFEVSLKNILRNKKRNILIVLASSIGIFCISFMMFLNSGVKKYISDEININFNPKELEVNKSNDPLKESLFTKSDIEKIKNIRHVRKVNTVKSISSSSSFEIENKKYEIMSLTSFHNLDKSKLKMGSTNGLLISEKLAKKINDDFKTLINKKINLYIIEPSKPCILTKKIKISGIIKEENELLDNMNYAYIPNKILEEMYRKEKIELKTSILNIYVDNEDNMKYVKKTLKSKGYYYSATTKMINKVYQYVDIISLILIGISGISLIVSSIMIYIIMHINVVERTKEVGILKSLGMTKKEIKRIFLYESSIIGLLSGILGTVLSICLSAICNHYTVSNYKASFFKIDFKFIFLSVFISILISSKSGLKPAKKASKLDPINSLRYE